MYGIVIYHNTCYKHCPIHMYNGFTINKKVYIFIAQFHFNIMVFHDPIKLAYIT